MINSAVADLVIFTKEILTKKECFWCSVCESKLDASEQEIIIDDYKILCCDRNRHGKAVACYLSNDLSYNILSAFPREIENIFLEILLINSINELIDDQFSSASLLFSFSQRQWFLME